MGTNVDDRYKQRFIDSVARATPEELGELWDAYTDALYRVRWLLTYYNLWGEEGYFAFPDGDLWRRDD